MVPNSPSRYCLSSRPSWTSRASRPRTLAPVGPTLHRGSGRAGSGLAAVGGAAEGFTSEGLAVGAGLDGVLVVPCEEDGGRDDEAASDWVAITMPAPARTSATTAPETIAIPRL